MSMTTATSKWIKFFIAAGIPMTEATNYAIIFTDNRIQEDSLIDLNKEYLADMGIVVTGDVIAILKHAQLQSVRNTGTPTVHTRFMPEEKSLRLQQRRSNATAVSRIVDHCLGSDPNSRPLNQPWLPTRATSEQAQDKLLTVSDARASSVFDRLGTVDSTTTSSALHHSSQERMKSFSKVIKRAATSTCSDMDDIDSGDDTNNGAPLKYAGVLKRPSSCSALSSLSKKQRLVISPRPDLSRKVSTADNSRTDDMGAHSADVTNLVSQDTQGEHDLKRSSHKAVRTEGILSPHATSNPSSVKQRLGRTIIAKK